MSRYRLLPSPAQEAVLREHCRHARFVWNIAVEQHKHWRPGRKNAPGYLEQCRQLTAARREHAWLRAGSQMVQQQALRDFARAMANFFGGTHCRPSWRKTGRDEGFRSAGQQRISGAKPIQRRRPGRRGHLRSINHHRRGGLRGDQAGQRCNARQQRHAHPDGGPHPCCGRRQDRRSADDGTGRGPGTDPRDHARRRQAECAAESGTGRTAYCPGCPFAASQAAAADRRAPASAEGQLLSAERREHLLRAGGVLPGL